MPGTIQVTVAGLMDVPREEARTTPFTLKVVMGKREYQSIGQGDCSVPVVSIRENLMVMIHDLEGRQLLQAEFRTIALVEKGVLEESYPLEAGGLVHMKLQFSLSQEEHKRIREMRDSALMKRKHGELLMDETKHSVSAQRNGNRITYSYSTPKGALNDQLKKIDSDSSCSSGTASISQQPPESSTNEDDSKPLETNKKNLKIRSPVDNVNKWKVLSEDGIDRRSESLRSQVSGNAADSDTNSTELKEKQTQRQSNVRKLVTALETSQFQEADQTGLRVKSLQSKINTLNRIPSEESDVDKFLVQRTISKSFSSCMLFDKSSQQDLKFSRTTMLEKQEEMDPVGPPKRWETVRNNGATLKSENDQKITNRGLFLKRKEIPQLRSVTGTPDAMPSSPTGTTLRTGSKINPADKGSSSNDSNIVKDLQFPENTKAESVQIKGQEIESTYQKELWFSRKSVDKSARVNQSSSLSKNRQALTLRPTTEESGSEYLRIHADEGTVSLNLNETACLLTSCSNGGCNFGCHGVWANRRVCITTGNRQLREFADCHMNCLQRHQPGQKLSEESNAQKPLDEASTLMPENIENSSISEETNDENPLSSSKFTGGLIEQGVRIAIVVVACATLLFNTRKRETKKVTK